MVRCFHYKCGLSESHVHLVIYKYASVLLQHCESSCCRSCFYICRAIHVLNIIQGAKNTNSNLTLTAEKLCHLICCPRKRSFVHSSKLNSLKVCYGRSLWASPCPPWSSYSLSGVQRIHQGARHPSSHSWPPAKMPTTPSPFPLSPVTSEWKQKSRQRGGGAGNGRGTLLYGRRSGWRVQTPTPLSPSRY